MPAFIFLSPIFLSCLQSSLACLKLTAHTSFGRPVQRRPTQDDGLNFTLGTLRGGDKSPHSKAS